MGNCYSQERSKQEVSAPFSIEGACGDFSGTVGKVLNRVADLIYMEKRHWVFVQMEMKRSYWDIDCIIDLFHKNRGWIRVFSRFLILSFFFLSSSSSCFLFFLTWQSHIRQAMLNSVLSLSTHHICNIY